MSLLLLICNVGIACVLLLGALVMGLKRPGGPCLVLGKAKTCVLCFLRHQTPFPIPSHPGFSTGTPQKMSRIGLDRLIIDQFVLSLISSGFHNSQSRKPYTPRVRFSVLRRTMAGFFEVGIWNLFMPFWVNPIWLSASLHSDLQQPGILEFPQGSH